MSIEEGATKYSPLYKYIPIKKGYAEKPRLNKPQLMGAIYFIRRRF